MKKSKFLKKSLAMLLALMLVVAMIPLSASAADNRVPELTSATVTVNNGTAVAVAAKDKTFTVDVSTTVEEVKVEATLGFSATLQFKSVDGVSHLDATTSQKLDNIVNTVSGTTTTIPLLVRSEDKNNTVEYSLVINKTDKGTTTNIATAVVTPATGGTLNSQVYDVSLDKENKEITARVPRGTLTKAKIDLTTEDNAILQDGTNATFTGSTLDFTNAANVSGATTATFTVKSQSGNNVATWTINIVRVDALSSISVAGVEGVFSDEDGSNDGVMDTITVTLPVSAITDEDGDLITNPELVVSYTTQPDTTIELNDAASGTGGTDKDLVNGKKFTFTGLAPTVDFNTGTNQNLKCSSKGLTDNQTYALIVKIEESTAADVTWAQLDKEIATVGENTITAELPATNFATDVKTVEVTVRTAPTAQKVEITNMANPGPGTPDKFAKTNTGNELKDGYAEWQLQVNAGGTASTVDLTNGAVLTVTAEDGNTKNYTVTATKATNVDEATLTAVTLMTASGTKYEGSIVGKTITFNVPYMATQAEISSWTVYATACAGANAKDGALSATIVPGVTTASGAFTGLDTKLNGGNDVTYSDAIAAVNKTNTDLFTKYDVVFDFAEAAKGNTITDLYTVSSTQATAKAVSDDANEDNTDKAVVDNTKDTITITTAASLKAVPHYVSKMTTATGAVALMYNSGVKKVVVLDRKTLGTVLANNDVIVVLPEALAKKVLTGITSVGNSSDLQNVATTDNAGTVYTVKFAEDKALNDYSIKSISVGGVTLSVAADGTISGTIPYSATTGTTPQDSTDDITTSAVQKSLNPQFLTFELGKYAKLGMYNANTATYSFTSAGDTDNDGEAEGWAAQNMQIVFVRDNSKGENDVIPYIVWGNNRYSTEDGTHDLTVYSEEAVVGGQAANVSNPNTYSKYKFKLTYADPSSEAVISSFKLGNTSGSISGRTINVTMPYGTDLTALIPTFTTSIGADVTLGGSKVISGKTVLNFTSDVALKVTSEDGSKTLDYTVKVTVADQFTDVNPGDWFYDNVMRAVELGIAKGKGNGIFDPYGKITRRDFAIMLAQAMGQSNDGEAVSPFVDVSNDDYGVVSIAFLYEKEITVGDSNGKFNPDANITRQEVAIMMAKAFEATGTSSEQFTDDAKIASWAKSYVYAAKAAGLMNGDVDGSFRPNDSFTRAEAASAMVNAIDK